MRKMFIFFVAFWVSFMTIYSIYYYKVQSKLDESIVANVKDLPHTVMGLADAKDSDKNMIYTEGVSQVIPALSPDTMHLIGSIPDTDFVSFNGTYTKEHLEKFYEGLVTKFTHHPPISFSNLKDGQRLLLSYYFENIRLPDGFRVSDKNINYRGHNIRALQYYLTPNTDTGTIFFYKNDQTHEFAVKVKFNNGKDELVMYNDPSSQNWKYAKTAADALMGNKASKCVLTKTQSVLIPEIDFNIVKDYDKEYVKNNPLLSGFDLVENRIKFKISPPKGGGPLEVNNSYNTATNFTMDGNVLYYIRQTDKLNPYCVIYVTNPEILKPARAHS